MTIEKEEYWTTLDGRRLAVGEMEEAHVREVLRMILRNTRIRREAQARMLAALSKIPEDFDDEDRKWGD